MRRFLVMATTPQAAVALGASVQAARTHGHAHDEAAHSHDHGHSHSGGHGHSHGTIEANIKGRNLFACKMATLAGGTTNVFFGVTKLYLGSSGGSVALMADGFHSVTDIAADIVSYFSISMSDKKLPRCRYPFGIGRLETSGAVVVAGILFFGGLALLIQSFAACIRDLGVYLMSCTGLLGVTSATLTTLAYKLGAAPNATGAHDHDDHDGHDHAHDHVSHVAAAEVAHGHSHGGAHGHSHFALTEEDSVTGQQVILWSMVMLAASSIVVKELLYRWTRRVGQRAGSRVVVANAYHHRADAWSGGVALLGVLGTCIGVPGIDGVAGCIVSLSICRIGYYLFKGSILEFFDNQNTEELAGIRAQLQDFHVSVANGKVVMATNTAGGGSEVGFDSTAAAAAAAHTTQSVIDTHRIRFVNVFLMRHGHSYVLYITFLTHEDATAAQIEQATSILTTLAQKSLPVEMTYTNVQLCQRQTVPKAEYLGQTTPAEEADTAKETEKTEKTEKCDHDAVTCASETCAHDHGDNGDIGAHPVTCAATGAMVNPSLEKIIHEHHLFHGSAAPILYNWEKREMTVPSDYCSDCLSDAESIASMFHLKVVTTSSTDQ